METRISSQDPNALRAEIRRASKETQRTRGLVSWLGVSAFFLSSGLLLPTVQVPAHSLIHTGWFVNLLVGAGAVAGCVPGFLAAATYRRARRGRFRRALQGLPPEERAAVLLSLRSDRSGDTRKLVAPLMRELTVGSELMPASLPPGRGSEPSPG
jgi:hypothetical protein